MKQILIADDHPLFRNGLKQIINEEDGWQVKDEAANGREVLKLLAKGRYDLLVLDLDMPEISGFEVLSQIKTSYPDIPVLVLSFYPEKQYAIRVLKLGARGYLAKDSAVEELMKALDRITRGRRYIGENLADQLADYVGVEDKRKPHEMLSDRETQVMILIGKGMRTKEIAVQLNLSPKTVSTYKTRIFEKFGIDSEAHLVRYVIEEKLI